MKLKNIFFLTSKVYGIIVSAILLLIIALEIGGLTTEKVLDGAREVGHHLVNWYDNPTGFFITYFLGYGIVWWRTLLGSLIVIVASILATLVNWDNPGWFIFTLPIFLVGLLYGIYWHLKKDSGR